MKKNKITKDRQKITGGSSKKSSSQGPISTNESVVIKNQVNDRLTKINLGTAIVAIIGVGINATLLYMANQRHTNNVYFQVDKDKRIVTITPVSQPNQSVPAVASWLKSALEETFHMNFYDYKERLSVNTALYFTEGGGDQLISALERSRSLELMEEREMWLSLTLNNPVFIKRGMHNGRYRWHFQVSGQLSQYNIASRGTPDQVVFDIYIDRMDELERERGLGISRLVMDRI